MTAKAITGISLLGVVAVAGTVGLLLSGGATAPRRIAKKSGKVIDKMSKKMQAVAGSMAQG